MTPDDVAAIRAQAKAGYAIGPFHVMALIDALEATWAERDEIIESYRELRDKCNDAYLQRDVWQVRANTAEAKVVEWRDASFAVDAQLRHAQTERDALLEEVKDYEDSGLSEGRARYWRERAERAEADFDEVKAEHRDHLRMCDGRLGRLKQANAALARVRALCDELHDTDEIVTEAYDRLRAAIEGVGR